jgi:hypothetical protein
MPVKSKKEELVQSDIKPLIIEDFDWSLVEGHPLFKRRAEEMRSCYKMYVFPKILLIRVIQ